MLNPFPIQFLAPLAYVLLRVAVGVLLVKRGSRSYTQSTRFSISWFSALTQVAVGLFYILGLYTQIAALVAALLAFCSLFPSLRRFGLAQYDRSTTLLVLAISLALFITGSGPFGFDLPI